MKIIMTESQYDELSKVDDVYDGLDPYFRRRINYINIKSDIDERIEYRTAKVLKHDPRGLAGHMNDIIHNVVWETIPDEWDTEIGDETKSSYADMMFDKIKMKYGKYIIKQLNKIIEDEDNNN